MARIPKIRAHYSADAQYMLRLVHAVERDTKRSADWRKKTVEMLQTLALHLMQAPTPKESTRGNETKG